MLQERLEVSEHSSVQFEQTGLIVSVVRILANRTAEIVAGRPGVPNLETTLGVGGAVLIETPEGLFEVRALSIYGAKVGVLVTQVSPRPGLSAGYVDQDPSNAPFSPEELKLIADGIDEVKAQMVHRSDLSTAQQGYVLRKLDEMVEASERLGRKDWMNLAVGTLTSIVVTAALNTAAAKGLIQAAGAALSWLFSGSLKFLP